MPKILSISTPVSKSTGQLVEVRFPVGISMVLFALVCLGGVIFWCYPTFRDELTFFGAAFGMAAGVVAAYCDFPGLVHEFLASLR